MTKNSGAGIDLDKFRLRRFVERMIGMGEMTRHRAPVALTSLSSIIEGTRDGILFEQAGPEKVPIAAKVMGARRRIAAAFDTTPEKFADVYQRRLATPQEIVEIPSDAAPVHQVVLTGNDIDLSKLPFHPQHELDGSCYISSGIDFTVDPQTGRRNVGSRRLSLRNNRELGTNVTSPSDLKRIYQASIARGEPLPITFTIASHPLDMFAAIARLPGDELRLVADFRGEPAAVVKSVTNDILIPADAEAVIEGYLDRRGYIEPEGPYGEYMGYYGVIHLDPVFHCTAITMRSDAMFQTLLHGSAFDLDQTDCGVLTSMRVEVEVMRLLKTIVREPIDVYLLEISGGSNTLRVSIRQHEAGEARKAIEVLFTGIMRLKHVFVFDEDIDIHSNTQVEWALSTRFQADQDLIVLHGLQGLTMDPSLEGRRTGAKAGFDCTRPFGRGEQLALLRCAAKTFDTRRHFSSVEEALRSAPMFYPELVEALGSSDGREVACAIDQLRSEGRLGRDRFGRYHLSRTTPGRTGIVGELDHDPNAGT